MYRRSLLKKFALGSTLASPLTSLLARSAMAADSSSRIKTLFIFHPNGCNPVEFFPEPGVFSPGATNMKPMCTPMERVKQHCLFLNGVGMVGSAKTHEGGALKCLTGVENTNKLGRHGLTSIEVQMGKEDWANREQTGVTMPSIQMGCGTQWGDNFDKRVSFNDGSDLHAVDDPRKIFASVFGASAGGGNGGRLEALAQVKAELTQMRMKLGQIERDKLDQHIDSLAVLEGKLNPTSGDSGNSASICETDPDLSSFDGLGQGDLWKGSILGTVSDVQQDLAVRALACGVTRTIAFSYGVSVSPIVVPGTGTNDHDLSHVDYHSDPGAHRASKQWWMEEIARFIEKMAATPDGPDGSSLLDNTIICTVSDLGNGNKHSHYELPLLLAGGKNTGLVTNRGLHIGRFGDTAIKGDGHPDNDKPAVRHADILTTIAERAGYTGIDIPTTVGRIDGIWEGGDQP